MIQISLPDYINDEHFHVYYMTVSGHMEYSFGGNTQAAHNKEAVEGLPYSSSAKAYIACNKELDKALEYLISELEKAGIADKVASVIESAGVTTQTTEKHTCSKMLSYLINTSPM